jgi:hypothetical protein
MLVVVPYTDLKPETSAALAAANVAFDCIPVGKSDTAYWELLDALWSDGEDFAIVEQDIVVEPGTLHSFAGCSRSWCCATYPYLRSEKYAGSGCVRFRAELIERVPDLMQRVAGHSDVKHPPKMWCSLDAFIQRELRAAGYQQCLQHGGVGHLHRNPSHGCLDAQHLYQGEAA